VIEHLEQIPPPEEIKTQNQAGWKHFLLDTIETILLALVLTFGINLVSARVRVENISMQPTLHQGEFLLVYKLAYKNSLPRTGDIIIFHAPPEPGEDFIKRVIGAPGDRILIQDGQVYVNDILLKENYIADSPGYTGQWDVPADSVFVLGDNRNSSSDSHVWGFVPLKNVVGKALLIYWPANDATFFQHSNIVTAAP
jgi:signal peptidase I